MEKVKKLLEKELKQDSTVIVSCSGGPDSMCLLSLVLEYKDSKNLNIVCAHVNHKKREESEEEEKYVENFAEKNNIIFELLTNLEFKDNFQADASKKRQNFLKTLQEKYKASTIMTAHHGDDLVETVLMRITRGSNISGYKGFSVIETFESYNVIKPLIYINKEQILEYNKNNSIKYFIDKSNESEDYTRNRYRKKILPSLKEEHENIHNKYLVFSEKLNEYDTFVKKYIDSKNIIKDNKINLVTFKDEENFIRNRVIEKIILNLQEKDYFPVNDNIINEINKLIYSTEGKGSIDLPNGYKGIKKNKEFFITNSKNVI